MVKRFSKKKIDERQLSLFDNLKTKEKENDRHNENTIQNTIGTQHRENIPRAPQTFETGWASTTGDETDIRKDGSRSRTYRHTEQSISRDDQQISSPNQQRDTETGENSNRLHEKTEKLLNKPFNLIETSLQIRGGKNFSLNSIELEEVKGLKARFKDNIKAIKIIHDFDNRLHKKIPIILSKEEKEALASYTGWGALHHPFEKDSEKWQKEYEELIREVKNKDSFAYARMKESSRNAYYTSKEIIDFAWKGSLKLGFKGGKILEPSAGVGKFIGYAPDEIKNNLDITFNELDKYSYKCAYYLYPKTEAHNKDFKFFHSNKHYDFIFQNPPFGSEKINDPSKEFKYHSIHNYFIAKSNKYLKKNGIMTVVVSSFFLDAKDSKVRKELSQSLELITAFRLPNNTFKNTSTEVTADIIFFKKNKDPHPERWTETHIESEYNIVDNQINNYYIENPQNLLGIWSKEGSMYMTNSFTLKPDDKEPLKDKLKKAYDNLPENYAGNTKPEEIEKEQEIFIIEKEDYMPKIRSYFIGEETKNVNKKEIFVRTPEPMLKNIYSEEEREYIDYKQDFNDEIFYAEKAEIPENDQTKFIQYIKIGRILDNLIKLQINKNVEDQQIEFVRDRLKNEYKYFVQRWGNLNKPQNKKLFYVDTISPSVLALENTHKDNKKIFYSEADILTKRTQYPYSEPVHADTPKDALLISLEEKGRVDIDYMANLCQAPKEKLIESLKNEIILYSNKKPEYQTHNEYLSGNVITKLEEAKEAAALDSKFQKNVELLKTVQPKKVQIQNIHFLPSSHWIPEETQNIFCQKVFGSGLEVKKNPILGKWEVGGFASPESKTLYNTNRKNAEEIYSSLLTDTTIKIYDYNKDKKAILNEKETIIANESIKKLENRFKKWVWDSQIHSKKIEDIYNKQFNRIIPRKYNSDWLNLKEASPEIKLRKHQKEGILYSLDKPRSLMHHEVGAGKTLVGAGSVMENKRLGRCTKPMIVVPNHLIPQWETEFKMLYPNANLLIPDKKDFQREGRRILFGKIANNEYDAIIIPHSQLIKIPLSIQKQKKFYQEEMTQIEIAIEEFKKDTGQRFNVKTLKKIMQTKEAQFEKLLNDSIKDQNITFEEMGIDMLVVDESQTYKNLFYTTGHSTLAGLGRPEGSQRALDLYAKIKTLEEIRPKSKIIFLSGTPVSNSLAEIYSLQRYLDPNGLEQLGIKNFDNWLSSFGEKSSEPEIKVTKVDMVERLRKLKNLPELMSYYKNFSHVVLNEQIVINAKNINENFSLPEVKEKLIVLPCSQDQWNISRYLIKIGDAKEEKIIKTDEYGKQSVEKREVNMLEVMTRSKNNTLDQRAYNSNLGEAKYSKINILTSMIKKRYHKWDRCKGTQLVFLDFSIPIKERQQTKNTFSFYENLKEKLILQGIPKEKIAFIHSYKKDSEKEKLFEKMNSGEMRVLIGSTPKLGAGTNIQKRLITLYHVDCPWTPSAITQRTGRIKRQGNLLGKYKTPVEVIKFATENTLDSMNWQIQEQKGKAFNSMLGQELENLGREIENIGEKEILSSATLKAASTGNKDYMKEINLKTEIKTLQAQMQHNQIIKSEAKRKLIMYQERITNEDKTKNYKKDLEHFNSLKETPFEITIENEKYIDKKQANEKILQIMKKLARNMSFNLEKEDRIQIGEYKSFKILSDKKLRTTGNITIKLKKDNEYYISNLHGVKDPVIIINNELNRIENCYNEEKFKFKEATKEIPKCENIIQNTKIDFNKIALKEKELIEVQKRIAKIDFEKTQTYKSNIDMKEVIEKIKDTRNIPVELIEETKLLENESKEIEMDISSPSFPEIKAEFITSQTALLNKNKEQNTNNRKRRIRF